MTIRIVPSSAAQVVGLYRYRPMHVGLEVRDWGISFDLGRVTDDCFGLLGVRERAEWLGGRTFGIFPTCWIAGRSTFDVHWKLKWGCVILGTFPRLGAASRRVAAELDVPKIVKS